jgi:hypothetical protein
VPADELAGLSAVDVMRVRAYNETLRLARMQAAKGLTRSSTSAAKALAGREAAAARLASFNSHTRLQIAAVAFLILTCGAAVAALALHILV